VLRSLLVTRNERPRAPLIKQHVMQSVRHSNSRPTNLTGLQTNNIGMDFNVSENLLLIVAQTKRHQTASLNIGDHVEVLEEELLRLLRRNEQPLLRLS